MEFDDENSFLMMPIEKNDCFCYFSPIFHLTYYCFCIIVLKRNFSAVYYQWNADYSTFISFVLKKKKRTLDHLCTEGQKGYRRIYAIMYLKEKQVKDMSIKRKKRKFKIKQMCRPEEKKE
jgi:hypothetical protein